MSAPKPPFHSAAEELLYAIYQKLGTNTTMGLSASDINTLAKLNAIVQDADLVSSEAFTKKIEDLLDGVPPEWNTLAKLYQWIRDMNPLLHTDLDSIGKLNDMLQDADVVSAGDLTAAMDRLLGNVPNETSSLGALYDLIGTLIDQAPEEGNTLHKLYNLITTLQTALAALDFVNIDDLTRAIEGLKSNTPEAGDTLQKLYNLIIALKGDAPDAGNTLEKLYNIIQNLNYLKTTDIDTLDKINAIITDADLVKTTDLISLLDNVPDAGNTLKKLYDYIGTKQDAFGAAFPNTLFVSPNGNDTSAQKNDFSKPFTPAGAMLAAQIGDTISFLPGAYTINTNIAKSGVTYTTFAGKVSITVNQQNAVVFNFDSLPESTLPVTIAGDFDFTINAAGATMFDFKQGNMLRKYIIKWSNAYQYLGSFIKMPTNVSTVLFEGNIEMDASATSSAIQCRAGAQTVGAGTFKLQINNKSTSAYAIAPWFQGFVFIISYQATTYGLFAYPLNSGHDFNEYTLNLIQADACSTIFGSGNYRVTVNGGSVIVFNNCHAVISGRLNNCTLTANPATTIKADVEATSVTIINDQVKVLKLDGTWTTCKYVKTSTSLCILEGQFYDLQFLTTAGILKITGYVRLKDTTSLSVDGNGSLEISGKLVASAPQVLFLMQTSPIVISGQLKQLLSTSPVIKAGSGGVTHVLTLKNAVMEAGSTANAIQVDSPDNINLKIYGTSYSNKPIAGSGAVTYLVGSKADFVVDDDVAVVDV